MARVPQVTIKKLKVSKRYFTFHEKLLFGVLFVGILNLLVVSYPYIYTYLIK